MNADVIKIRNPVGVPCFRGRAGRSVIQGRFAQAHQPFAMMRCAFGTRGFRSPKGFRTIAKGCRTIARLPWNAGNHPMFHLTEPQRGSASAYQNKRASIPDISFIPFDAMFAQHHAVFILKGLCPMMLGLIPHILDHGIRVRLAHRKSAVTRLPMKRGKLRPLLTNPDSAGSFHFLHPIRQRHRAIHSCQDMNVISHTAYGDGRTFQFLRNAAEVAVHSIHLLRIRKPRLAVLGREHEMQDHVGKRLRHKEAFDISSKSQAQIREADTEPRWGSTQKSMDVGNPFQGSGFAATLRYDTVSRRDTMNPNPDGLPQLYTIT